MFKEALKRYRSYLVYDTVKKRIKALFPSKKKSLRNLSRIVDDTLKELRRRPYFPFLDKKFISFFRDWLAKIYSFWPRRVILYIKQQYRGFIYHLKKPFISRRYRKVMLKRGRRLLRRSLKKIKRACRRFLHGLVYFDYLKFFFRLAYLFGIFIICLIITGVAIFLYYTKDIPSIDAFERLENAESTKIYDRTGKVLLYEIHAEEKRTVIDLDKMPEVLIQATLAAEDKHFFDHEGVNIKSQFRAIKANLENRDYSQGASTITQQLIKNTILTKEKTFDRKIKEMFLAFEIERKYEKKEILEMYLNRIPYGMNTYGIQAAATTFFDKDAKDLSLAEATVLAALPQRPSKLSPYGPNRDTLLRERQLYILSQMQKLGYITEDEKIAAINEEWAKNLKDMKVDIKVPHFVFFVKELLEARAKEEGMYGGEIETAGLKVITTIDLDLQYKAEAIVKEYADLNKVYNIDNMALAAVETNTGQIVTMVGSVDYWDTENDGNVNVTTSYRQPGSSFKPYVYAAAFQRGLGPYTTIYDVRTDFGGYRPNNYSNNFAGPISAKQALLQSRNIPAIKAFYAAGPNNVVQLAHNMGLENLDPGGVYGLATALGTEEIRLIDHVAALSTFGNRGYKIEKTPILKIYDQGGNLIEDNSKPKKTKVMEENIADLMNFTLTRSSGSLKIPGYNVAAKTGTTNKDLHGRSYPADTWTIGWTPKIAVGVWAGNNDGSVLASSAVSTRNAGPTYKAFMTECLKKYPGVEYVRPKITGISGGGWHSILYHLGERSGFQYQQWEKSLEGFRSAEEAKKKAEEEKRQKAVEAAAAAAASKKKAEEEVTLEETPTPPAP